MLFRPLWLCGRTKKFPDQLLIVVASAPIRLAFSSEDAYFIDQLHRDLKLGYRRLASSSSFYDL